tara:strand:- start:124 stop:342 length:219 start_codon:yes stop_codon:yes gene_type:complete
MNNIDSIDKKITEVANDNLDGIESYLTHIDELDSKDFSDLHEEIKEMLGDLNKNNFRKAGKFIVNLSREEEE